MQKRKASIDGDEKLISSWIEEELGNIDLGDERLNDRARVLMNQFSDQPSASIPQACGEWKEMKAAYRFLSNDKIAPEKLLEPHVQATIQRVKSHDLVLAVQDTTTVNYSAHRQTKGLGPISNNREKTLGFFLHATLAVTPEGCPLGLFQGATHSRNARDFGGSRRSVKRNKKAISEKESQRWLDSLSCCQQLATLCPATTIVNVADREADIYELFAQALDPSLARVHLLVRVQHNRLVESSEGRLWADLAAQPEAATMQVKVPRQDGKAARIATLSVRYSAQRVCPPRLKKNLSSLSLWAIEARELHPPQGVKPILWQLLTTLPLTDASQAIVRIGWYAQRWQIEVLHKVLKSGCRIEQRQLSTVPRLQRALMLDLILAWRILYLSKVLREQPDESASIYLTDPEWKVLWCKFNRTQPIASQPPSIGQAIRWIAYLGGFIGRKSDGHPGPIVLWRGLHRLHDLADSWTLHSCG